MTMTMTMKTTTTTKTKMKSDGGDLGCDTKDLELGDCYNRGKHPLSWYCYRTSDLHIFPFPPFPFPSSCSPLLMIWSAGDRLIKRRYYSKPPILYVLWMNKIIVQDVSYAQLSAVESLHSWHYVHHDIKPANFMVHTDTVFLIDCLAQLFCNPAMYWHVLLSTDSPDISTLPCISVKSQRGFTQSHCNNLESLPYTIIYGACGDLP